MSEQRPRAPGHSSRAIGAIFICTSYPNRKRLHLQLLHASDASLSVRMLSGRHVVLATIAEVAVLLPVLLHEVVDRPQPESGSWARGNPLGTLTVSVPTAAAAVSTSIRVQFFTPLTVKKKNKVNFAVTLLYLSTNVPHSHDICQDNNYPNPSKAVSC